MASSNPASLGKQLAHLAVGATAALGVAGTSIVPRHQRTGPVVTAAASIVGVAPRVGGMGTSGDSAANRPASVLGVEVASALGTLASGVRQMSHPQALEDAFRSYFAYHAAHPDAKPYLYFVDYGLPSTTPRGYVFDMAALRVIDGPFAVAHGRGSSDSQYGVPTHFSNAYGSAATSLGLYVAQELYAFRGHVGGRAYNSVGLRLAGVSDGYNENARARRVVAHGAPYVTNTQAGRSEGCPALEPSRAERLLPKLANGGLVFLFAPDPAWMTGDPWLTARPG